MRVIFPPAFNVIIEDGADVAANVLRITWLSYRETDVGRLKEARVCLGDCNFAGYVFGRDLKGCAIVDVDVN